METMMNEKRNLENMNKLAPHTRDAALKWYDKLKIEQIEVLVYETIRTLEKQKENLANGKSETLKSYHLVGQALDWVLINKNGTALWDDYKTVKGKRVVELAKMYGFLSGGDWKTLKDYPHLEFHYKGYGTDVKERVPFPGTTHEGDKGELVEKIQTALHIKADGIFGPLTTRAVKDFQLANKLSVDGLVGPKTFDKLFNE